MDKNEMNSMEDTVDNNIGEQPVIMDTMTDALMAFEKIAQMLERLDDGLTPQEKLDLRQGFEGLSYTAMVILMDAEIELKNQEENK